MQFIDIDAVQVVSEPAVPDLFVDELARAILRSFYTPMIVFQSGVVINREVVLAIQYLKARKSGGMPAVRNVVIMGDRWFVAFTELPNAAPVVLPPLQVIPWMSEPQPTIVPGPYTIPTTAPNTTNPWTIRIKFPNVYDPNSTYTTWSGTASSYYADGGAGDPLPTQ